MNIYILVTQFCLLRSLALPHYEDKKTKARQGFGPEGKHVLTEEEETNGIYAGDGTNGILACGIVTLKDQNSNFNRATTSWGEWF